MAIIGTLLAVPTMLLFYTLWALLMLLRPFLLITLLCVIYNLPNIMLKMKMWTSALIYMALSKDGKWKNTVDVASYDAHFEKAEKNGSLKRKQIIFIRHGESCWNDTFNAGERSMPTFIIYYIPNLIKALCYESWLFVNAGADSWFYDSPLSYYGVSQVNELKSFLGKAPAENVNASGRSREVEMLAILNGTSTTTSSVLISSTLRRCISTMTLSFQSRLTQKPSEKIIITGSLQEISRNVDTQCITPPFSKVQLSFVEDAVYCSKVKSIYDNQIDSTKHNSNKTLDSNGLIRMNEFNHLCMHTLSEDVVICGGHSLYFRTFFRTFSKESLVHKCKSKKIVNAGVVGFDLVCCEVDEDVSNGSSSNGGGGEKKKKWIYKVDESTIEVVYGGF